MSERGYTTPPAGGYSPPARDAEAAPASVGLGGLTPAGVLALQAGAGNGAVGRMLSREPSPAPVAAPPLPSIAHLPAMTQRLLEGALEKNTVDEAVRQIYDNTFTRTGWTYCASTPDANGKNFVEGRKSSGMCESYRNAFKEILRIYDGLRATHPVDAVKNGVLDVEQGDDLVESRFATRKGLTLMGGTALKGNVYLEVDGGANVLGQGADAVNTFIFRGHWTLKVNGVEYDPIFHSIGVDNIATQLDQNYAAGQERYVVDTGKPIPTKEFGATFIHVTDWPALEAIAKDAEALVRDHGDDIEALISGSTWKQMKQGILRPKKADAMRQAKAILARIGDRRAFEAVIDVDSSSPSGKLTRNQRRAYDKLVQLAG
jgi:hypothetical protein